MWERCVFSVSSGLSLSDVVHSTEKGPEKNSSWEGEGINALCQLIGQWVTDSLNRGIDSRKEIDLWLLQTAAQMNVPLSLILQLMFYELEPGHNTSEATKKRLLHEKWRRI